MIPQYIPDSFNLAAIDIGSNAARLLIKSVTKQEDGTLQFQNFACFPKFPDRGQYLRIYRHKNREIEK